MQPMNQVRTELGVYVPLYTSAKRYRLIKPEYTGLDESLHVEWIKNQIRRVIC